MIALKIEERNENSSENSNIHGDSWCPRGVGCRCLKQNQGFVFLSCFDYVVLDLMLKWAKIENIESERSALNEALFEAKENSHFCL